MKRQGGVPEHLQCCLPFLVSILGLNLSVRVPFEFVVEHNAKVLNSVIVSPYKRVALGDCAFQQSLDISFVLDTFRIRLYFSHLSMKKSSLSPCHIKE